VALAALAATPQPRRSMLGAAAVALGAAAVCNL